MIPAPFDYTKARTLAEALQAVSRPDTKVVAGGQTLIPLLRFRLAQPKRLVDIGGITQLTGVRKLARSIRLGAATTYRDLIDSRPLRTAVPLIAEVADHVGDRQVRNIATIGGGLAHADPASDMPAAMLALDVVFHLQSRRRKRTVPAREFFTGAFETVMKNDELLTAIVIPLPARGTGMAYVSFDQPASGYALVGAAAVLKRARGQIVSAALAFTGLAEHAFLASSVAALVGTKGTAADLDRAAKASVNGVEANDDIHASAEYRLHLGRVAARRALEQAQARTR